MFIHQILRFGVVGLINTLVGALVIIVMSYSHVELLTANALGYIVGFGVGAWLNKAWTFKSKVGWLQAVLRLGVAYALALMLHLTVVWSLTTHASLGRIVSQIAGAVCYVIAGFLLSRSLLMRSDSQTGSQIPTNDLRRADKPRRSSYIRPYVTKGNIQ